MKIIIIDIIKFLNNYMIRYDYKLIKSLSMTSKLIKNNDIINAYYILQRSLKYQIEVNGTDEYQDLLNKLEENAYLIGLQNVE